MAHDGPKGYLKAESVQHGNNKTRGIRDLPKVKTVISPKTDTPMHIRHNEFHLQRSLRQTLGSVATKVNFVLILVNFNVHRRECNKKGCSQDGTTEVFLQWLPRSHWSRESKETPHAEMEITYRFPTQLSPDTKRRQWTGSASTIQN